MRPHVIITLKIQNTNVNYDMELPVDVPVHQLRDDIIEALTAYNHKDYTEYANNSIYCERLHMNLPESITLGEMGIWSGDILIIKERE